MTHGDKPKPNGENRSPSMDAGKSLLSMAIGVVVVFVLAVSIYGVSTPNRNTSNAPKATATSKPVTMGSNPALPIPDTPAQR